MTGVIGTSDFPTAVDSHTTLMQTRDLAITALDADVSDSATTFIVADTSKFPPNGYFTAEGEHVVYASKDSTHFFGCSRGQFTSLGGSAAAPHTAGAAIKQLVIAKSHEVQNDALIATQTKVGSGASTPASAKFLRGNGAGTSAWDDIHSSDVAAALGFTPANGITVQVGDADQGTNITTVDLDSAYFAAGTESPDGEYNLTLKSGAVQDAGTLSIASGVITLPAIFANVGVISATVDTESAATNDDLDAINVTGTVNTGVVLILRALSSSRNVAVKNGTGNLTLTNGDFILATVGYRLVLMRTGSSWVELARQPLSQTYQLLDAELTAIAGLTSAANKLPYFTGSGTAALTDLTAAGRALAGLTGAADKLPYLTGSGTAALADISAAGRALIDDASVAAMRATLGVIDPVITNPAEGDMLIRDGTQYINRRRGQLSHGRQSGWEYEFDQAAARFVVNVVAGGSIQALPGESQHPGIFRLSAAASNGSGLNYEAQGGAYINDYFEFETIFRPTFAATANRIWQIVLADFPSLPTIAVGVAFDATIHATNWVAYKDTAAGSPVGVSLGVPIVTNEWYRALLKRTGSGAFDVTIERLSNGATGTVNVSGLDLAGYHPIYRINNTAAVAATLDVDWTRVDYEMLTR